MFVGKACGRAEEAVDFYTSVFQNSEKEEMIYYREDEAPDKEGIRADTDDVRLKGRNWW
jgi:predicted 3-demethylubiquinone-9 3-methyltransferase (glyoxalase superfamily)